MTDKIDKKKMERVWQEFNQLGNTSYKFIEPFIINVKD